MKAADVRNRMAYADPWFTESATCRDTEDEGSAVIGQFNVFKLQLLFSNCTVCHVRTLTY